MKYYITVFVLLVLIVAGLELALEPSGPSHPIPVAAPPSGDDAGLKSLRIP